jgi:hypothetical protein
MFPRFHHMTKIESGVPLPSSKGELIGIKFRIVVHNRSNMLPYLITVN